MTHVAHELHAEFPNDADTLHKLKVNDPHFAKLADHYHDRRLGGARPLLRPLHRAIRARGGLVAPSLGL